MRRPRAPVTPPPVVATATPSPYSLQGNGRRPPPPSPSDAAACREFVKQMILARMPYDTIVVAAARRTVQEVPHPFDEPMVERAYEAVCKGIGKFTDPEHRERARGEAVYSVRNDLTHLRAHARGQTKPDTKLYNTIAKFEHLLSLLEGTQQPLDVHVAVDVDVRVRGAMMRVVSDFTADELDAMANEQLDLERRAAIVTTGYAPPP